MHNRGNRWIECPPKPLTVRRRIYLTWCALVTPSPWRAHLNHAGSQRTYPKVDPGMLSEPSTCVICDNSEGENTDAITFVMRVALLSIEVVTECHIFLRSTALQKMHCLTRNTSGEAEITSFSGSALMAFTSQSCIYIPIKEVSPSRLPGD